MSGVAARRHVARRGPARAGRRRPRRRRRHRPRRRRTPGEGAAARASGRDPPARASSGTCPRTTGRSAWGARDARRHRGRPGSCASGYRARRRLRDRRVARDPRVGTLGGNLMNASPAMETGGPLLCLGATVTLRSASGARSLGIDDLLTGPGQTTAAPERAARVGRGPAARRRTRAAATSASSTGARWRSPSSAPPRCSSLDGDRVTDARLAITALAPTIRRVPEAEAALSGTDAGRDGRAGGAPRRPPRPCRSPTSARPPTIGARWPR